MLKLTGSAGRILTQRYDAMVNRLGPGLRTALRSGQPGTAFPNPVPETVKPRAAAKSGVRQQSGVTRYVATAKASVTPAGENIWKVLAGPLPGPGQAVR